MSGKCYGEKFFPVYDRIKTQTNFSERINKDMNFKKALCLCLASCLLLLAFTACTPDSGETKDPGDRVNGSWDGVDFGGDTVRISISANQDYEVTFPACDIYTQGPDGSTTDEIQKKVLIRNQKVEQLLNLKAIYDRTDLDYNEVLDDIEKKVLSNAENTPDVYNNDMYGILRAMPKGYFWNVLDPGENGKSFFDFSYDGWNYDFMKGLTFDQNKMYVLAGDYFLDMIRMAWVLYVNADHFNANGVSLGYGNINEFYEYVAAGIWDWDDLTTISSSVWKDTSKKNTVDKDDELIGLAINHVSDYIFMGSSGVTVFYQDKSFTPHCIDGIDQFMRMGTELRSIMEGKGNQTTDTTTGRGILFENKVITSTEYFFNGNVLFAMSVLGELESTAMRGVEFAKGLVPVPKWNEQEQEDYHTMVHDQTEIAVIFSNAPSFTKASAFMQAANEESRDVLHEYYEKGLKFKYSDDKNIRTMIDLIHDTIDNPFGLHMPAIIATYFGNGSNNWMWTGTCFGALDNTVASTFGSEKQAYQTALTKALADFAALQ